MALDCDEARKVLSRIFIYAEADKPKVEYLKTFIDDVDKLMKNNSIKRIPALFRPFDEGD